MKDNKDIITNSLMARIRELEQEVATKDFSISRMCLFFELKDDGHSLVKSGVNLQENYINFVVEDYDSDDSYELDVRLNPDDVEHAMLSHFKNYKSEDEDTIYALESYINRRGVRK